MLRDRGKIVKAIYIDKKPFTVTINGEGEPDNIDSIYFSLFFFISGLSKFFLENISRRGWKGEKIAAD